MLNKFGFIFICILLSACLPNAKNKGKVIKVKDGDSIVLLDSLNRQIEVRLAFIDAPERYQDYGKQSKQFLSNLVFKKQVTYNIIEPKDRYGRIIGDVYLNDSMSISKAMLRNGMAWHFDDYPGGITYQLIENKARKNKLGLWKDNNPTPPWEYRRK